MSQRDYEIQEDMRRMQLREIGEEDDGGEDDGDDGEEEEEEGDEDFMPFGDPTQLFISESGLPVADILSDCAAGLAGIHEEAAKLNKILTFMAKKMK